MISTVLGPATVLLMIIGAFNACFGQWKRSFGISSQSALSFRHQPLAIDVHVGPARLLLPSDLFSHDDRFSNSRGGVSLGTVRDHHDVRGRRYDHSDRRRFVDVAQRRFLDVTLLDLSHGGIYASARVLVHRSWFTLFPLHSQWIFVSLDLFLVQSEHCLMGNARGTERKEESE